MKMMKSRAGSLAALAAGWIQFIAQKKIRQLNFLDWRGKSAGIATRRVANRSTVAPKCAKPQASPGEPIAPSTEFWPCKQSNLRSEHERLRAAVDARKAIVKLRRPNRDQSGKKA